MAQKNVRKAVNLTLTTTIVSFATFALIIYEPFQNLIIDYPYLILLTVVINLVIGKFTGLRLLEYFRFQEVFPSQD